MNRILLIVVVAFGLLVPSVAGAVASPENASLAIPKGKASESGWPTILLLHGYGMNKEDFTAVADLLAAHGFAVLSVDAPVSLGENRRSWPSGVESTYRAIRPSLDFISADDRFDAQRVFVGGFSQGAFHSLLLGKHDTNQFSGLLVISPGGGTEIPEGWSQEEFEQPLYLLHGRAESPDTLRMVERVAAHWREAGQRVRVQNHGGGHQLPADWETVLADAMKWLAGEASSE